MSITSWNSTRFSKFFNARLSRKFATKLLLHLILNLKNVASLHYAASNRNVSQCSMTNRLKTNVLVSSSTSYYYRYHCLHLHLWDNRIMVPPGPEAWKRLRVPCKNICIIDLIFSSVTLISHDMLLTETEIFLSRNFEAQSSGKFSSYRVALLRPGPWGFSLTSLMNDPALTFGSIAVYRAYRTTRRQTISRSVKSRTG